MNTDKDTQFLEYALQEAANAFHEGSFPVGAVLVDSNGKIIGTARNTMKDGSFVSHAEISLIWQFQNDLQREPWSSALYSSLEPCIMCMGAAIITRLARVVWAANDHWAGATRTYDFQSHYIRSRPLEIVPPNSEHLEQQSLALISKHLTKRSPSKLQLILHGTE